MLTVISHTPTTSIYTLSLHDALPICDVVTVGRDQIDHRAPDLLHRPEAPQRNLAQELVADLVRDALDHVRPDRSEEHTSELQSLTNLVCRLLLEKKKKSKKKQPNKQS